MCLNGSECRPLLASIHNTTKSKQTKRWRPLILILQEGPTVRPHLYNHNPAVCEWKKYLLYDFFFKKTKCAHFIFTIFAVLCKKKRMKFKHSFRSCPGLQCIDSNCFCNVLEFHKKKFSQSLQYVVICENENRLNVFECSRCIFTPFEFVWRMNLSLEHKCCVFFW